MAIEYTPKETSNLVTKISEGGAFQTSGGQELSTSKSFASKSVAASRDAATSEANAQSSETSSAASASASSASASSSATSATASASSSSAAATSETAAGTSETNAATSETNAATSTTNAATSETNASTSATNAATSATNASTSETGAATSATNAAASYDSFDDRYLGPKASAPTLDNDGGALLTGALYFNSTSDLMKIWSGSLWLDAFAPSGTVSWGVISGALSDQTDLKDYIDTKLPLVGGAMTGPITTNSTFDGRDVSVDGAKLDGVEALADVTGTTNVVAALTAGNGVDISAGGVVAVSAVALTTVQTAVSEIAQLALSTQEGDVVVRSDLEQTFMHNGGVAGTIADFTLLSTPTDSVTSVDGLTGVVTLDHDSLAGFVANEHVDYTAGGTFGGNINVTGTATMGRLVVSGSLGNFAVDTQGAVATFSRPSTSYIRATDVSGGLRFDTGGSVGRLSIANNGDISFYEDTGTTAKFFWDASAESLGVGGKAYITADANVGYFGGNAAQSNHISFYDALDLVRIYTAGQEAMRIDSSGNVGIGTSSPKALLDVSTSSGGANNNTVGSSIAIHGTTQPITGIRWTGASHTGIGGLAYVTQIVADTANNNALEMYTTGATPLVFGTNETERMRIDSSGGLFVGTTTRSFGSRITSESATSYTLESRRTGTVSEGQVVFVNGNGSVGSIFTNGSATSFNTSSDYRLKDITGSLQGSGDYIDSLNPVEGTWKADGSVFVGLIAHEADEASRTKIATGEKDGEEMQGMDYSSSEMIANLISEVQDLRKRVLQLEGS